MKGPTAAKGTFPYAGHRTVAQVDDAEIAWNMAVANARLVSKGPGFLAKLFGPEIKNAAPRSTLPDAPCLCCGARGYCAHRSAAA